MKAELSIKETLVYKRHIEIELPDGMDEDDLHSLIEKIESRSISDLSDYTERLERAGVKLIEEVDNSLDSPDHTEIECDYVNVV